MAFSFGNNSAPKTPALNFGNTTTSTSANPLLLGLPSKDGANTTNTQQPTMSNNQSGSLLLGLPQNKSLFGGGMSTNAAAPTNTNNTSTLQPGANPNTSTLSTGGPQIDIAHLRSTTKYDHLTPGLQQDILALDTAILNQIRDCTSVADLLPAVTAAGSQIAPAIDFVSSKLDELETGLENDAEAVVSLRDGDVQKDAGEAKCVFRTVDRLKVPRQYQVGGGNADAGGVVPGFNGGLSGWWNQPAAFSRGSSVRAAGAGSSVQILDDDAEDDKNKGPKSLIELFNGRAKEMGEISVQHGQLLAEIEDFVGGLEEKVYGKERELNERLDNGMQANGEYGFQQEKEHQMQLLRYVFGEVQRNLYEVAEKIGSTRDGVVDLTFKR